MSKENTCDTLDVLSLFDQTSLQIEDGKKVNLHQIAMAIVFNAILTNKPDSEELIKAVIQTKEVISNFNKVVNSSVDGGK